MPLCLGPPTPPSDLKVTSSDPDSVTLSWTPPQSDGGSPIQAYILEIKRPGDKDFSFLDRLKPRLTEYTAFGLEEGQEYNFRIRAKNPAGESEPACELATPFRVPVAKSAIGKRILHFLEKSNSYGLL